MGKATVGEQWPHNMAGGRMGRVDATAVWLPSPLWLCESREARPLGPADATTEVCKEQPRTRLKQVDWGQGDTRVLAGAHLAPFWVIRIQPVHRRHGW